MRTVLIIALLTAFSLAGCGGGADQSDSSLHVVATTTILGDVVRNIVGDDGVEVLAPTGADPHDYQASSNQVASINTADLVVANGLHLEEGLEDVLVAAEADGARIVWVGELVDPLPFGEDGNDHEDEADHEDEVDHEREGQDDPHFWMDPLRVAEAARAIGAELSAIDPDSDDDWMARAEEYAEELEALDARIIETLSVIPDGSRKLVTNHDSMGYFAERYDCETIGVIIPGGSTLGDPSSQELAELVHIIEDEQVAAIFAETTEPSALADAVAAEVGREVGVVELFTGSLGEPGSGADTYIGMMRVNAELIADALR